MPSFGNKRHLLGPPLVDHFRHVRGRRHRLCVSSRKVAADGAQPRVLSRPCLQHKVQAASGRAVRLAQPIREAPAHAQLASVGCFHMQVWSAVKLHTCVDAQIPGSDILNVSQVIRQVPHACLFTVLTPPQPSSMQRVRITIITF